MANRVQRLDVDLEKCYERDLDWTLLPEKLRKVLNDLQSFGLGEIKTFTVTGNKLQVYFFKKASIPEAPDQLKTFIQMLAKCGVNLSTFTTAYNAQDEESNRHMEEYQERNDGFLSPSKKRKV